MAKTYVPEEHQDKILNEIKFKLSGNGIFKNDAMFLTHSGITYDEYSMVLDPERQWEIRHNQAVKTTGDGQQEVPVFAEVSLVDAIPIASVTAVFKVPEQVEVA